VPVHEYVVSWDTCILIDAIQKTRDTWEFIAPILDLAEAGDLKIVISTISLAECYYLRYAAGQGMDQTQQNGMIDKWLEHSFLIKRAADLGTCRIAAEVCRATRGALQAADAIIVATALRHGASALLTYDNKAGSSLLAQDGKLSLGDGRMLQICAPQDWIGRGATRPLPL
jgi:predicted nucleic acid-binding protein